MLHAGITKEAKGIGEFFKREEICNLLKNKVLFDHIHSFAQ